MDPKISALGLTATVLLAGCLGPASSAPSDEDAVAAAAATDVPAPPVNVVSWEGHVAVGAAAEPPAHMRDTEALVSPVWRSGFNLQVDELPSVVEIRFDWTSSTPSRAMFMAHVPDDPDDHRSWVEFENPHHHANVLTWPTEGPMCMRITTEDLAPGHWHVMAHTAYGSDVALNFTITTVGGVVSVPDGLHGHRADAEEARAVANIYTKEPHGWSECELSGDEVAR